MSKTFTDIEIRHKPEVISMDNSHSSRDRANTAIIEAMVAAKV